MKISGNGRYAVAKHIFPLPGDPELGSSSVRVDYLYVHDLDNGSAELVAPINADEGGGRLLNSVEINSDGTLTLVASSLDIDNLAILRDRDDGTGAPAFPLHIAERTAFPLVVTSLESSGRNEGTPITLTAEVSEAIEPNAAIWTQTAGPTVELSGSGLTREFTFSDGGSELPGPTLTFELTVTNDSGLSATESIDVAINRAPITRAFSSPLEPQAGDTIVLSAEDSIDPEGGELTYFWRQLQGPAVGFDPTAEVISFVAPDINEPYSITIRLDVTDAGGLTSSTASGAFVEDTVLDPPSAGAGSDQTIASGATGFLNGFAADSDGRPDQSLSTSWEQISAPSVTIVSTGTRSAEFTAPELAAGSAPITLEFLFRVVDQNLQSATDTVVFTVQPPAVTPSPPIANAGPNLSVDSGTTIQLSGAGSSDPDGDIVSFAWVAQGQGVLQAADTISPTFLAPTLAAGSDNVTTRIVLTVRDATDLSSSDELVITTVAPPAPDPVAPIANAGNDQTANPDATVQLNGAGSTDSDGTIVNFQWSQVGGTPVVLAGSTSVVASFVAPSSSTATTLSFELRVTDNDGLSSTDRVNVLVDASQSPPFAFAGPDRTITSGGTSQLLGGLSTDPDGNIESYNWQQVFGPVAQILDAQSPTATLVAPILPVGADDVMLIIQLTVTDTTGLSASDTIEVIVESEPPADSNDPVANAGPDITVVPGDQVTLSAAGSTDPDNDIVSYRWDQIFGSPVSLQNRNQVEATFIAPAVDNQSITLSFGLTIEDSTGRTSTDVVNVGVRADEQPILLAAAVLPTSRSVEVGTTATAFATVINTSPRIAEQCALSVNSAIPASFFYRTTDPLTNAITGEPDTPIDIAGGGVQTFIFGLTPDAAFAPTEVGFSFDCSNASSAIEVIGVNTLLLSASETPAADIVALGATPSADGILDIPQSTGIAAFGVASINLGSDAEMEVTVDTGAVSLPMDLSICQSDPATGACLSGVGTSVDYTAAPNGTPTFSIFAASNGPVAFAPATHRIRVRFLQDGVVRGATSVAVRTTAD